MLAMTRHQRSNASRKRPSHIYADRAKTRIIELKNEEAGEFVKLSPREKAEQTTAIARDILTAEATAREKKTERLRALRLAQQTTTATMTKKKLK